MSQLDAKDGVAIAQIVVYTPALAVAVLLASRHGFKRSAGWLYLVLFGIIRILGAALELATISDRENTSLIGGAATLQTIGLSPLILVMLALSSRVLTSVNASRTTFLKPRMLQGVKLIVLVGLILGIVGGTKLSLRIYDAAVAAAKGANGGKIVYTIPEESQAGLGLMMAGYVLLVLIILLLATDVAAAAAGEKRILGAIAAALPFVLVRLIYSAIAVFDPSNTDFRQYYAGPNFIACYIGMAVVMEMIAILIIEAVGLTLRQLPKADEERPDSEDVPKGRRAPPAFA